MYTDILKRLTPFQARLINAIYFDPRCCSVEFPIVNRGYDAFFPDNELLYNVTDILSLYPGDLSEIVPIADISHDEILQTKSNHDIALSRFKPQIDTLKVLGLIHNVFFQTNGGLEIEFYPSLKGLDFFMRCLGYSIYPLEAFILTLQHWNKLENIDPFSYKKTQ